MNKSEIFTSSSNHRRYRNTFMTLDSTSNGRGLNVT